MYWWNRCTALFMRDSMGPPLGEGAHETELNSLDSSSKTLHAWTADNTADLWYLRRWGLSLFPQKNQSTRPVESVIQYGWLGPGIMRFSCWPFIKRTEASLEGSRWICWVSMSSHPQQLCLVPDYQIHDGRANTSCKQAGIYRESRRSVHL